MGRGWWDPVVTIPPLSPAWPQRCRSRHQLHRRGGKVLLAWSQLGIAMPLVSRNIWALTSLFPWEMHNFSNAAGAHLNGFFLVHTTLLMPSAGPGIHAHSCLWISCRSGLCNSTRQHQYPPKTRAQEAALKRRGRGSCCCCRACTQHPGPPQIPSL